MKKQHKYEKKIMDIIDFVIDSESLDLPKEALWLKIITHIVKHYDVFLTYVKLHIFK